MAMAGMHDVAAWIGAGLAAGSWRGGLVVIVVSLACRRVESMPAVTRASLWWLASLAMLIAVLPVPRIPVPVLPPAPPVTIAASAPPPPVAMASMATDSSPAVAGSVSLVRQDEWSWVSVAILLWLVVMAGQAWRLAAAHCRLRRVVRRARHAGEVESASIARLAREIGLSGVPAVRVSDEIDTPQAVGLLSPLILLPATMTFTADELRMTLCHELLHIRRRDLVFGWIPAIAERVFFFHPLARLAGREYLVAREAACDAAVVHALGVEPWAYGRLLVRFGITRSESGLSAAGSSTSASLLQRRLAMLEGVAVTGVGTRAVWCAVAAMMATALPLKLVARAEPGTPAAAAAVQSASTTNGDTPERATAPAVVSQREVRTSRDAARQRVERRARVEQSKQRLAELEAEREKRLSQLRDELAQRLAEQEAAKVESLLDAMRQAAETSGAARVEANPAMLEAIEAQARRLAEQARQQPEAPALAERLRGEMESLRAQVAKLEEERETLVAQQRALVAAQQQLSAEVAKLTALIGQLEGSRAR